ncbi:laccase domain-containing protein, partial [Pseudomonas sp. SIMBA_041]|uniref:laccase domain-containing protein n=1 Tax=Pseudomonas sp. SIMBA_041 TaxID=3085782 RepID=UPI0039789E63
MTQALLLPDWPAPASVRACVTTRQGGVSLPPFDTFNLGDHVGDDPAAVAENRHCQAMHLLEPGRLDGERIAQAVAVFG